MWWMCCTLWLMWLKCLSVFAIVNYMKHVKDGKTTGMKTRIHKLYLTKTQFSLIIYIWFTNVNRSYFLRDKIQNISFNSKHFYWLQSSTQLITNQKHILLRQCDPIVLEYPRPLWKTQFSFVYALFCTPFGSTQLVCRRQSPLRTPRIPNISDRTPKTSQNQNSLDVLCSKFPFLIRVCNFKCIIIALAQTDLSETKLKKQSARWLKTGNSSQITV